MMVRALHGLADCFLLLCTISFPLDCAPATSRSLIANQYVRVSKVELPSHDSLSLRANGHLHVLIAEQPEAVSVMQSDSKQAVTPSENLWTLDGIQSYQIFNRDESQVSVLLLEITPSPGRVVCSGGNACPWSIRDVDPWPVFLSDHLTIFKIPLPWTPEADSVIVPTVDVAVSGAHRDAWDAVWME